MSQYNIFVNMIVVLTLLLNIFGAQACRNFKTLLDHTNSLRSLHNVNSLTWSRQIARRASKHAKRCIWQHSSSESRRSSNKNGGYLGENLYASYNSNTGYKKKAMKTACIEAIDAWYAEEAYYNYDTYSQKAGYGGQTIGHFTQLVWAATRKFGCGVAPCRSNGRPFVIVVCQFYEAGNYAGYETYNVFPRNGTAITTI